MRCILYRIACAAPGVVLGWNIYWSICVGHPKNIIGKRKESPLARWLHLGMSSVSFPWSQSHMQVAFLSCLQLQVAQTILLCHTLVFICHPPLYRVFGIFSVHVSYCVVFLFSCCPKFWTSGYIPRFMFALWNSTTAVQHQFVVESSSNTRPQQMLRMRLALPSST